MTPDLARLTLPDIRRQPIEAVRALQDRLLAETVEIAYRNHPFYGPLMRREGLEPRHIRSTTDLVRLPVTTKTDFLADPDAFRLRGDGLPPDASTLCKVIYTTGTTSGRPAPVYITTADHQAYLYDASRRSDFIDLGPGDILANLFPLTAFPMGAYSRAPDEAAAVGAAVVFTHTGRSGTPYPLHNSLDAAVDLVAGHRATVIYGVASFVRRLLLRAEERGADLSALRLAMITGEASSSALRDDVLRRLRRVGRPDARIVNRYGSTEQGSSMLECQEGSGFHVLAPDQLFVEVVDPESGRRLPDGESGHYALTHLARRGTMFLRYAIGDVLTLSTGSCPHCGRTSPRLHEPMRVGDLVKIKGTLVNLQVAKDWLDRHPGISEYQIVIEPEHPDDPFSMDAITIRLASPGNDQALADDVARTLADTTRVTPRVVFAAADAIYDPAVQAKHQRILDRRSAKT